MKRYVSDALLCDVVACRCCISFACCVVYSGYDRSALSSLFYLQ
jgi:hypothetical protein